jgi:hypothetical protein
VQEVFICSGNVRTGSFVPLKNVKNHLRSPFMALSMFSAMLLAPLMLSGKKTSVMTP